MSNISDELEQIVFCTTGCGSNADPADGFGYCTCGEEDKRKAVQALLKRETLKARSMEIKRTYGKLEDLFGEDDAVEVLSDYFDNRLKELEKELNNE